MWEWIKRNTLAIVATIAAIFGAGILWQHHKRKVGSLKDLVAVEKAQNKITVLNARREALAEQADVQVEHIEAIDSELIRNKREIVAVHAEVATMSDEDVANAFKDLGYEASA